MQLQMKTLSALAIGLCASGTFAHGDPDFEINYLTIGDLGNLTYPGGPNGEYAGRGSIDYEFRISQTELTSGQYIEYLNLFSLQSPWLWAILNPGVSGYDFNIPETPYWFNTQLTHPEDTVVELDWTQAAMFANWLHNGQTDDSESLMNGVYDISTLQSNGDGTYEGQAVRSPGARFWIPSVDEHLKAGYFDPDKNGNGPGWWSYGNSSDELPVYGVPGVGQVARELTDQEIIDLAGPWGTVATIPLGIYEDEQSPWGLLDLLGGSREWLEDWAEDRDGNQAGRLTRCAGNSTIIIFFDVDQAWYYQSIPPFARKGFRIASAVFHPADLNEDWSVNYFDVSEFIQRFVAGDLSVDFDGDGDLDIDDVIVFLGLMNN